MRPNPAKARPKKQPISSVADVGDDLEVDSPSLAGCYAALSAGLVSTAVLPFPISFSITHAWL